MMRIWGTLVKILKIGISESCQHKQGIIFRVICILQETPEIHH